MPGGHGSSVFCRGSCVAIDWHGSAAAVMSRTGRSFQLLGNTDNMKFSKNDDRERNYDAHVDYRAFCRYRCIAGRDAIEQRAITVFISMVFARWHQLWLECPVLLLHELGAVQDNNVRHRWKLHREPVLPWGSDTTPASRVGEAASSPARLRAFSNDRPNLPALSK
jgi:hypothetical protein